MEQRTPLYEQHLAAGASMVDFAGWSMPIHYGSQIQEHHWVREDSGMFDVSHMAAIDVDGKEANAFLRYVLANDVNKLLQTGHALYSCMLNEAGGVIDDLIIYYLKPEHYRLVVNAGTRLKDKAWLDQQAQQFQVQLTLKELAILAVQGPKAREKIQAAVHPHVRAAMTNLKAFDVAVCEELLIARTGYTGEDGVELMMPANKITELWQACIKAGIHPCGLGARDTLRLEAGLNLYGSDMDETTTPLESNLGWTVAFVPEDRAFIGRAALVAQKHQGVARRLVGLILEDKGVLRSHQKVVAPQVGEGETTSGTFSPTLGRSIALARVPAAVSDHCFVEIRGKQLRARVVKPPFVRYGKKMFE
jgi:aminomethyltransferase